MNGSCRIEAAREQHLSTLPTIELAAAQLLVGHASEAVLTETTDVGHFRQALLGGRLWVALADETPVGFVHVVLLASGAPHLEEIDVHPSHGRQGLGRRLVGVACDWAAQRGHADLTLTTFRDVPFNMPFYVSCGFREVPAAGLNAELTAMLEVEAKRGLDPTRRAVMRWRSPVFGR